MLYAEHDVNGEIIGIKKTPSEPNQKELTDNELIYFLSQEGDTGSYETLLTLLDTRVIRVLDDLIDLLVQKNVIMFTELPDEARKKIGERKIARKRLLGETQLMVDDIL